jgi:hypothetical protein
MLRRNCFAMGSCLCILGAAIASYGAEPAAARQEAAFQLPADKRPASWTVLKAGDLGAIFDRQGDGLQLVSLFDLAKHRQLLAGKTPALFTVTMRQIESKEEVTLRADAGWEQVQVASAAKPGTPVELSWQTPKDKRLKGLRVAVLGSLDETAGAMRWKLSVDRVEKPWAVRRVVFPQVAVDAASPQFEFFYPKGPGQVKRAPWPPQFSYGGMYPQGWISMQFMAASDKQHGTGLYYAMHDPQGSSKDFHVEWQQANQAMALAFDVPAENMDVAGNGYASSGEAVWQVLHGDWFDAALIYRAWVRQNAAWFPKLTPEGRADTPLWMRELPLWAQSWGDGKKVVPELKAFAKAMAVPVGTHWYGWHNNPFDNDYPHYFPASEGFGDAVRELQANGVYIMPYINGRLWDTHDKGKEDFQFTSVARPAATKDEAGKPYIETYGSKESDGSPVQLAVMCPSTQLWQAKVRQTVLRLMNEYGTKAVYIDQVAAAAPVLCFDHAHGHPTGGGHWWTSSYNEMLATIRREKPADRIVTTECNAEPYVKSFDGYLTWHWCCDDQVPAFPAVYGGAIQMLGRAYRGGPTPELALRMKAGQQFVFGEQIGWFDPSVIHNPQSADFLRQVVGVRWQLRRAFYAGEMARPPKLQGSIPTVRADWQWDNPGWVTTDAVLTGAWTLPREHRSVLLFVNVSDQPVTARLQIDAAAYGVGGPQVRIATVKATGQGESFVSPSKIERELSFPARSAFALELRPIDAK